MRAQAHGRLERVEVPEYKARVLAALMDKYQPEGGFSPIHASAPLYQAALRGILILRVPLSALDGKGKLGQNRRPEELARVLEALFRRGAPGDLRALELVRRANPGAAPGFLQGPPGARLCCAPSAEDAPAAAELLRDAYWNGGVSREALVRAHLGSAAWVAAHDEAGRLIASARAISDGSKWAWIYDVVVAPTWKGRGLGQALLRLLLGHPAVRDARQVKLGTRDAQAFYRKLGFLDARELPPKPYPSTEMVLLNPGTRSL
jgi:N-acetylglutamate synthase-like GNAT family acetyltransferase